MIQIGRRCFRELFGGGPRWLVQLTVTGDARALVRALRELADRIEGECNE